MIQSKFKKALLKIKKRTIQALLYISEDKFDSAKSPFFTCFKIVIFFLQLEGYVYSQYESKPLNQPENIYLSNYTQLSPVTFFLLQIGNDILTQFFFYFIFCLHVTVYLIMVRMSLDSDIAKPNIIKKALNLFFINYQWIFVTPFQEISIGVMVCGKTAFIQENKDSPTCSSDKSKLLYIFGTLGTLFVTLSGFSISYFFRNYEFYDKTFSRQYSYSNLMRIIMHQFVIIFYYINFPGIDYFKHFLQQVLSLTLITDILVNQPFGYSFESNFYCAASFTHQYFLVLTSVWIFGPGINDSFFFFTLLLITPVKYNYKYQLLIILSGQFQKRDQIRIVNTFLLTQFNDKADKYLEEIYRTADESDTIIESKILFIQILNLHVKNCCLIDCPCKKNVQGFFNNNTINYQRLNDWSTIVFEKCLKLALIQNDYTFYEHMALKYVTFLAKYKNNPINAYSILQSIMNNQETQNINEKQLQKSSFYFFNIQAILQKRNRKNFAQQGLHHTQQLQLLLKGQSIIENIGNEVTNQIRLISQQKQKFWDDYSNNRIQTFQSLVTELAKVQKQIEQTKIYITMIGNKTGKLAQQCVSILNLELLFSICFTNNILETYQLQKQIQQTLLLEQQELDSYLNFHFQNQLAISIISNITQQQRGEIWQPNQAQLEKFFKLNDQITHINQLMPQFIADIHDLMIENLIKRGQSYLLQSTSVVFSKYGENLIQPLLLTIGYFFPKLEKDFQFYLIAYFKKVEENYKVGSQEINSIGYIFFDVNLNILGINEVIAEKLQSIFKKDIDLNKIELCYLLPVVVESFILKYKFMVEKEISNFTDSDLIVSKQQESFYIPDMVGKCFQINQNCSIKQRLIELEDIYDDLQKTNPFVDFQQHQISFQLFCKNISYQKSGGTAVRELFLVKLQFSDEQEDQQQNCKTVGNATEQNQIHTPNITSEQSPTIDDGIVELVSQRSKSSSQTILQQSNQFHSQLFNNQKSNMVKLFFFVNICFAGFFFATFMSISFTIQNKYELSSKCVNIQNQVNEETTSYASVVIALSNEQLGTLFTLPTVQISFNSIEQSITPKDQEQIETQLVNYAVQQFTNIVQQQTIEISFPEAIQLQMIDEIDQVKLIQNFSNMLIFRQVILTSAQNELTKRNSEDLSTVVMNYPTQIMLLHNYALSCFTDFSDILIQSTNNTTQILIFIYAILFLLFIVQLVIINRFIRKRKLILKLFTRIDYKEASLEAEKFKLICTHMRNCENFWLSSKISTLIQQLNSKSGKEEIEYGQKQSDRAKTVTKSEKVENTDNIRSKIQISHQFSSIASLIILTGITLFTFIYIISFHVSIVQASDSFDAYFGLRQVLQQFQYNYHSSFSNCYFQMLNLAFNHISDDEILPLIYLQNETMNTKLQQDLENLNSNNFSTILLKSNNYMNLLSLDDIQQQQLYQGFFCQLDEAICSISTERTIKYSTQLDEYYNQSIQQLLLQQGQIFAQNDYFYQLTENQTIEQGIIEIITSQNYFLNNLWGFDLIVTRVSNTINFLVNRMMNNLQTQGEKIFLTALIIGVFYFILTITLLIYFSQFQGKQNSRIRYYLIYLPFATIVKKNIHQQLKFID